MNLELDEYIRYGRQMILPGISLDGQLKLKFASVVVVGAGGLGCPALQYLAGAGIGRICIVDHDSIALSNLHRQILHTELGENKALSAAAAIRKINPNVLVETVTQPLAAHNALDILRGFSAILDCTDNAPTRYLLSDAAVVLGVPLISGAAQRFEGQLCVCNYMDGPCLRCIFPKPPKNVESCAETGIVGPVAGTIGTLQATEVIKLIAGLGDYADGGKRLQPSLLLYSSLGSPPFRSVRIRRRRKDCPACGEFAKSDLNVDSIDYVQFCGGPTPNWHESGMRVDDPNLRIDAKTMKTKFDLERDGNSGNSVIIDVRSEPEFGICHLDNSINIPITTFLADPRAAAENCGVDFKTAENEKSPARNIIVVCRLGNDSQTAAKALRALDSRALVIQDLIGGLQAWTKDVDNQFPIY
ncbi:hypothetical protein FISHEDRAFT_78002 [Fistulina hepatica ATCC 64428]|nr:hypothetical protein FISHEDRAFT_78002 [Fistulina hepatica ATCC 64428]